MRENTGYIMKLEPGAGQRLEEARKRADLSLGQVAEKIGVTKGAINQWENGLNIPEPRLAEMAALYGVSLHWVKTGEPAADISEVIEFLSRAPIPPEGRTRIQVLVESLADV